MSTLSTASALCGHRKRIVPHASAAPTVWATTKGATDAGAMPANVSESVRARVTAGLAKLVDDVKKYAPVMLDEELRQLTAAPAV
jgi:hypothetical protein